MQKKVSFQVMDAVEIPDWADAYPTHKFAVYRCCFLSTAPNSHKIPISDKLLRKYASTILGTWLIAKIDYSGDATTHKPDEQIYGCFPREQEIEFVEENNITKAYAYAVVSKRYSKELNGIFEYDNFRNSSIEATFHYADENDENSVDSFDIEALTCLGKRVNGSCPDANIKMIRFSQVKAEKYFAKNDSLAVLKQFVAERKVDMAEKAYKVDKSKEAMSDKPWGDVDKENLRNKIMEASNRASLVKDVYMLIEDGWEDAPSEHLKYPVMCFEGDTLVYNRGALASALGYAKKENESTVINKVEVIYKKLDLDDSEGKEEDANMEENTVMAEVELEQVEEVKAEEVKDEETEMAESESKPEEKDQEQVEQEHSEDEEAEEKEAKMSEDEMMARIAQLEKDIEERDNIIMGCNTELEELRQFKAGVEEKEKAMAVEQIMGEVSEFLETDMAKSLREEGMACGKDDIDGWANKCKAMCFSAVKKQPKKKETAEIWGFAAPIEANTIETGDIWARLKKEYK